MNTKMFQYENLSKYRSSLMGIQILLIMFFHFTEDCKNYGIRYSGIVYIFYNYVRSSGVDLFLLLSGLGLYYSWKKNSDKMHFYKKRFIRISIPYLIVAVPMWFWLDLIHEKTGWFSYIKDLSFLSFFMEEKRWFWYILVSGICYLIFPYVYDVIESAEDAMAGKLRLLLLCTASTVMAIVFQLYYHDMFVNIDIAILRLPAFFIGVWIGKASWEKKNIPWNIIWIQTGVAFLALVPGQMYDKKILGTYLLGLFNYCICRLVTGLFEKAEWSDNTLLRQIKMGVTKVLKWFGCHSIELYLIHVSIRKVLNQTEHPTYRLKYEAIVILGAMLLAPVLKKITNMIVSKSHCSQVTCKQ